MKNQIFLFLALMSVSTVAHAGPVDAIKHVVDMIPSSDSSVMIYFAGIAELLMRYVPSQKPLSVIHASAEGFHVIGDGLEKIAKILDRVFGQNQAQAPAVTLDKVA